VWLYFRFPLSLRTGEEMLAARGIVVNHEAVRQRALKFGQTFAHALRRLHRDRRNASSRRTTRSTTSSISAAITSPPTSTGLPGPRLLRSGPTSPASTLSRKGPSDHAVPAPPRPQPST
jgi:hypothetical protein